MVTNPAVHRKRIRSNSTSSVFACATILHSDDKRTLYYIAYILQADIFKEAADGFHINSESQSELRISPKLPIEHGGAIYPHEIPREVLMNETVDDPELRLHIELGSVPTVDTIFRFMCWIFDRTEVSPQTSLVAFLYLKRLKPACIFTTHNWRGLWVGCFIIAQKFCDDLSLLTSSFASILPGVSKLQLKTLEFKVFVLLNFNTYVKPAVYIQAYYNLRVLFNTVLSEYPQRERHPLRADTILCTAEPTRVQLKRRRAQSFDETPHHSRGLYIIS